MSLFVFWRRKKERGALLKRANELRLLPSQLKQLHNDSGVRSALQNTRAASLLPPVGTEVFRRFTPDSLHRILERRKTNEKEKESEKEEKGQVVKKKRPRPASELEAGKPLPFIYGNPPSELLNTQLEDLDPYYQSQKTFIVIGKGNIIHRFNAESALNVSPFNLLRITAINVLISSFFRLFIMATLLTNCVLMTLSEPPVWAYIMEFVFLGIYTFEVVVKMVSRGFCLGQFSFLQELWNWLDIVVLVMGYRALFVVVWRFTVVSTIARVLKLLPLFSGMTTTVRAVARSAQRLTGLFLVTLFCLLFLALCGSITFMGVLRHKCIRFPTPDSNHTWLPATAAPGYNDLSHVNGSFDFHINNEENQYFLPGQLDALLCGNSSGAGVCPDGYTCIRAQKNPNYGFTNYDTFGWSLLTTFRLITLDYWENVMALIYRAAGKSYISFFALFVFPCSFFLYSIFLSVVAMASSKQEKATAAEASQKVEEFDQIVATLKRREEEKLAASRAALSQPDGSDRNGADPQCTATQESRSCPACCFVCADLFLKWNCCGCWRWLKQRLHAVVTNPFFDFGIVICLILNTVTMAMEHYPMSMEFAEFLAISTLVFTGIFAAEMLLKILALDPYGYFKVGWNVFESIIVIIALMELGFADIEGLSLMRSSRLLRVVRLARWWPTFFLLIKIVRTSLRALRNLTLLLLTVVFLFSVVGTQLFAEDYRDCVCKISQTCELPRWHMTDVFNTFLIVVRAIWGQWVEVLWDCMQVSGQASCLIFFIMLLVIAYLLMLNLFVTLLLTSFSGDSLVGPEDNLRIAIDRINRALPWNKRHHVKTKQSEAENKEGDRKEYLALNVTSDQSLSQDAPMATAEVDIDSPEEKKSEDVQKLPEVQKNEDVEGHEGNTPENCCGDKCYRCCPCLDIDTSRGVGRVWTKFRKVCLLIVEHQCFNIFITVTVLLFTAALMVQDVHQHRRHALMMAVSTVYLVVFCVFLLEMLLKWIAFGVNKYFSDPWCRFDFLIFILLLLSNGIASLIPLVPLRALSCFRGTKLTVEVLVRSLPAVLDWVLVLLVVCLFSSIMGINMYAGKFEYCFNETSEEYFSVEEVNNKSDCLELMMADFSEVRWKNLKLNFDDVFSGFLSLMTVWASSDWMDLLYAAQDSRQIESQPMYQYNLYNSLYFVYLFIAFFFTMNLLVRVVVNNLQNDKFGGKHLFMTKKQQKHSKALKWFCETPQEPVPRPQNPCQAGLFDLLTKPYFEAIMVAVIFLSVLPLMVETYDMSWEATSILHWFNFSFILLFLVECVVKIIAFRRHYFANGWNVFDFVLTLISVFSMFVSDLLAKYFINPYFIPVLRLVRVARILHLVGFSRQIQKVLVAFVSSLPALFNLVLVFFIVMVTFSIFGMFNFAYIRRSAAIDDMMNFETFWNSMICMMVVSRSGGWFGLMLPFLNSPPDCDPYKEHPGAPVFGDCGNPMLGAVFFSTYSFLSFLLLLHMYIAVILKIFDSKDTEVLGEEDLLKFHETWKEFDPDGSLFIPYSKLSDLCDALQAPLRIPKPNAIKLIHMDLPLFPGDKVHREDVLLKLAEQVVEDSGEMDSLKARMKETTTAGSSKVIDEPISSTLKRKQEEVAATVIQRAYRKGLPQHGDAGEAAGGAAVDTGV